MPSFIHTPFLVNVGSPTEATVEQSIASIAHNLARGAELGAARAWSCTPAPPSARTAYEAALRQLHERLLPVLDALPDGGPRLLIEPTAGGGKALAATVEDLGPYLAALDEPPDGRRLLRHLPRLGGRPRPGDARRDDGDAGRAGRPRSAPAGSGWCTPTTRWTRAARSATGTRRSARARSARRRSPSCWPTRRWPASRWWWRRPSELDGSPSAGHARDIALLCSLMWDPAAA